MVFFFFCFRQNREQKEKREKIISSWYGISLLFFLTSRKYYFFYYRFQIVLVLLLLPLNIQQRFTFVGNIVISYWLWLVIVITNTDVLSIYFFLFLDWKQIRYPNIAEIYSYLDILYILQMLNTKLNIFSWDWDRRIKLPSQYIYIYIFDVLEWLLMIETFTATIYLCKCFVFRLITTNA